MYQQFLSLKYHHNICWSIFTWLVNPCGLRRTSVYIRLHSLNNYFLGFVLHLCPSMVFLFDSLKWINYHITEHFALIVNRGQCKALSFSGDNTNMALTGTAGASVVNVHISYGLCFFTSVVIREWQTCPHDILKPSKWHPSEIHFGGYYLTSGRVKFIPSRREYTKRHTLQLSIGCVTPALSAHPPVLAIIVAVWLMQYLPQEVQLLLRVFFCGCCSFWLHFFCHSCICAFFLALLTFLEHNMKIQKI